MQFSTVIPLWSRHMCVERAGTEKLPRSHREACITLPSPPFGASTFLPAQFFKSLTCIPLWLFLPLHPPPPSPRFLSLVHRRLAITSLWPKCVIFLSQCSSASSCSLFLSLSRYPGRFPISPPIFFLLSLTLKKCEVFFDQSDRCWPQCHLSASQLCFCLSSSLSSLINFI